MPCRATQDGWVTVEGSDEMWSTGEGNSKQLQLSYLFPLHTVQGVLKARILKWFAIPFSSGPHFVRPLHHDAPVLASPQAWLSFIELDKAVVLV